MKAQIGGGQRGVIPLSTFLGLGKGKRNADGEDRRRAGRRLRQQRHAAWLCWLQVTDADASDDIIAAIENGQVIVYDADNFMRKGSVGYNATKVQVAGNEIVVDEGTQTVRYDAQNFMRLGTL